MSEITTPIQARRLRSLGFKNYSQFSYYKNDATYRLTPKNFTSDFIAAPTVYEALDWVREEKGIECGVYPIMIPIRDGLKRMAYAHSAFDLNNNCKRLRLNISLVKIDTHHLASSALLYAVLTYLEQKEKKV